MDGRAYCEEHAKKHCLSRGLIVDLNLACCCSLNKQKQT